MIARVGLRTTSTAAGGLPSSYQYTLPTDAQWEYACRAGSSGAYSFGADASQLDACAWHYRNSVHKTHMVGKKRCNPWGLHDLHGNVWEWCLDWYDNKLSGGTDPRGPATGSNRVLRGGGYDNGAQNLRSAYRSSLAPEDQGCDLGFRIVFVSDP